MHDVSTLDCARIAQDLQIRKVQVEGVVQLLAEGNTIPFIACFRKERTGGLSEEVIRHVQDRLSLSRQLAERKQTILKSIEGQGQLTDELRFAIRSAETRKRLEDLYLPYKPRMKTAGMTAREAGLEPLALAIWNRDAAVSNLPELLPNFVNPEAGLATVADVQTGVHHLLAEMLADRAEVRAAVRAALWETGKMCSAKNDSWPEGKGPADRIPEHKDYFQFSESLRHIPAHRILALNRGAKEGALKTRLECNTDAVAQAAFKVVAELGLKAGAGHQESGGNGQRSAVSGRDADDPKGGRQEANSRHSESAGAESRGGGQESIVAAATAEVATASVAWAEVQPAAMIVQAPSDPAGLAAVGVGQDGNLSLGESVVEPFSRSLETNLAVAQPPEVPTPGKPVAVVAAVPPDPAPLPPDEGELLSPHSAYRTPHASFLKAVVEDALNRLLLPSLEKEIRQDLTEEAESHAVTVFAFNLKSLLLQPPLRNRRVLAIDPGFRAGCRIAVLDEAGNLLEDAAVHPHGKKPPKERIPKPGQAQPTPAVSDKPAAEPASQGSAAPVGETAACSPVVIVPATTEAAHPTALPENQAPGPNPGVEAIAAGAAAAPVSPDQANVEATPAFAPAISSRREETKAKLEELVTRHRVSIVAIGNGTGCRETEELISELIATRLPDLSYVIVNEAGASVYAVSPIGREEFPNLEAALRSTISIGRRLQDPLAELVKVDPQNIGVGLYQHDVKRKDLRETLESVVESCVNQAGVDLNTASVPMLRYISGLNQMVARDLVEHRKQHGPFRSREQFLQVPSVGPIRFVQAAGFVKITGGENPLDATWIHPESYGLAQKVLAELGYGTDVIVDPARAKEFQARLRDLAPIELAGRLGAGVGTVEDILDAVAQPGRDPREDRPMPIFKKGVLKLDDLKPGMELRGTVLNVVDFGAFVDIGLKESGLVHISQMASRYIKSPYDLVAVNDVVQVWVLSVDRDRHRVSLTMIKPGTERRQGEKREGQPAGRQRHGRGVRHEGAAGERPPPKPAARPQARKRPEGPASAPPAAAPPAAAKTVQAGDAPAPARTAEPPPPPRPPRTGRPQPHAHQHSRKHRREPPKPKLSQDALDGKVPLRTFGELSALFAAKRTKREPPAQPLAQATATTEAPAAPPDSAEAQPGRKLPADQPPPS